MSHCGFGKMLFFHLKVLVKAGSILFCSYSAAPLVNPVQVSGIIYASGAIANDDRGSALG